MHGVAWMPSAALRRVLRIPTGDCRTPRRETTTHSKNSEGDVLGYAAWGAQRCFQMQWPSKADISFSVVSSLSRRAPLIPSSQVLHLSLSSAPALLRRRGLVWTRFASVLNGSSHVGEVKAGWAPWKQRGFPVWVIRYIKSAQTQPTLDASTLRYTQPSTRSLLHHINADRCVIKKHKTII